MTDFIEIEGEIVRHIRREVVSETTLALAAPHLERRAPSLYPVLPRNTVVAAFDPDAKRGALIVERVPERVNLNVHFDMGLTGNTPNEDYNRGRRAQFNIQFPYLYFVYGYKMDVRPVGDHVGLARFSLDRSNLFWAPKPIVNLDDRIWPAKLANVNNSALICWGTPNWDTQDTMATRINQMVNEFPITTFTNHYGMPRPSDYASYVAWEAASENPLCFRDWEQFKTNTGSKKVDEFILKIMANGTGVDYTGMPRPEDMAEVIIPEPPAQFTTGRLRQWIETIPEPLRRRFLAEAARVGAEEPTDG